MVNILKSTMTNKEVNVLDTPHTRCDFFSLNECTISALHGRDFGPDKSVTILEPLLITQWTEYIIIKKAQA